MTVTKINPWHIWQPWTPDLLVGHWNFTGWQTYYTRKKNIIDCADLSLPTNLEWNNKPIQLTNVLHRKFLTDFKRFLKGDVTLRGRYALSAQTLMCTHTSALLSSTSQRWKASLDFWSPPQLVCTTNRSVLEHGAWELPLPPHDTHALTIVCKRIPSVDHRIPLSVSCCTTKASILHLAGTCWNSQ